MQKHYIVPRKHKQALLQPRQPQARSQGLPCFVGQAGDYRCFPAHQHMRSRPEHSGRVCAMGYAASGCSRAPSSGPHRPGCVSPDTNCSAAHCSTVCSPLCRGARQPLSCGCRARQLLAACPSWDGTAAGAAQHAGQQAASHSQIDVLSHIILTCMSAIVCNATPISV